MQNLFQLDRINFYKTDDGEWTVRGSFSLRADHDEAKRFVFFKRHNQNLSYLRFKQLGFIRSVIYVEIRMKKISQKDFDRIKALLWAKFNSYVSHKLEKLLLPSPVI